MQNLSYLARVLQSSASNMELIENLCELGNLSTSDHEILALSSDSFTDHHDHQPQSSTDHDHHQLPMNFSSSTHDHNYNIQSYSHSDRDPNVVFVAHSTAQLAGDFGQQSEKEKPSGGRKRKRNNVDKEVEKPKEVIHVRAKRGQATDSHSLAERVRREKINERLRCLQNLVPGCYKTMGMAVMLDVVISYVQSLQNQIEFLSMKLSAASVYYDFNSPVHVDAVDAMQGTNAYEVQEDMVREGEYGGGLSNYNHSTWPL